MSRAVARRLCIALVGVMAAGCSTRVGRPDGLAAGREAEQIRQTFAAFQAALKTRDGEALYRLLDRDSRADAEAAAKALQETYAKAPQTAKGEQEKALGLTGVELAQLTAAGYLKSNRFHGMYEELSESKIDDIRVQGDRATVSYTEPDGDKEKASLVREDGQWKVTVRIPPALP